jgi:hypothetical protein
MPRFTVKTLLISTALIAIGTGLIVWMNNPYFGLYVPNYYLEILLWLATGALIGAGICLPFKKPSLGAVLGIVAHDSDRILVSYSQRLMVA